MEKKIILIFATIIITVIAIICFEGQKVETPESSSLSEKEKATQPQETPFVPAVNFVSGTVKEIAENSFILDTEKGIKTIKIGKDTNIYLGEEQGTKDDIKRGEKVICIIVEGEDVVREIYRGDGDMIYSGGDAINIK